MLGDILPSSVVTEEVFGDVPDVRLFPDEEAVVAKAVDKRRMEFASGRACARMALGKLGLPPVSIPRGPRGAPRWPDGVVGSITHCTGYRGCAVARADEVVTIGLDAETHDRLPDGVLSVIASKSEAKRVAELAEVMPDVCWDRLLFSAKESVYKAWFPVTQRWLGFEEAEIEIDGINRSFTARLAAVGPVVNGAALTGFEGRWLVSDGLVFTAIAISRTRNALVQV